MTIAFNLATLLGNTSTAVASTSTLAGALAGGATGALAYQSAANASAFLTVGTAGQILASNGSSPTWVSTNSFAIGWHSDVVLSSPTDGQVLKYNGTTGKWYNGTDNTSAAGTQATSSTNLMAGTAGQIPYQTAPNLTNFIGPGTAGQLLISGGAGAPTYVNTGTFLVGNAVSAVTSISANSAVTASYTANLLGGTAGSIMWQSGVNGTSFSPTGSTGQYLQSNGTSAPTWTTPVISVNTATSAQYLANSTSTGALTPAGVWSAAGPTTVADSATVTLDLNTGINFSILLTTGVGATRTIANPNNIKPGQTGWIAVTQSASGSNAVTFGTQWHFSTGTVTTVSNTANAVDLIYYTAVTNSYLLTTIAKQWF